MKKKLKPHQFKPRVGVLHTKVVKSKRVYKRKQRNNRDTDT